jgi:hypothetical protein
MEEKMSKSQELKKSRKNRKAQEEMVGFIIIIVLVVVVLLFLLAFSLRSSEKRSVDSYEVESFIQTALQYTSDCADNREYFSMQDLIFECNAGASCLDGRLACSVMEETLESLADASWPVGENRPVKGYELTVNSVDEELFSLSKGNQTANSKGGRQPLPKESIEMVFTAYS